MFLKILQYSRENTYVGVSFLVGGLQNWNFIKKRFQHRCFREIFKNTFFNRTPPVAAFD